MYFAARIRMIGVWLFKASEVATPFADQHDSDRRREGNDSTMNKNECGSSNLLRLCLTTVQILETCAVAIKSRGETGAKKVRSLRVQALDLNPPSILSPR